MLLHLRDLVSACSEARISSESTRPGRNSDSLREFPLAMACVQVSSGFRTIAVRSLRVSAFPEHEKSSMPETAATARLLRLHAKLMAGARALGIHEGMIIAAAMVFAGSLDYLVHIVVGRRLAPI